MDTVTGPETKLREHSLRSASNPFIHGNELKVT
jgi:hypothetical protein